MWGKDITPEIEGLPRCFDHRLVSDRAAIGGQAYITRTLQIGRSWTQSGIGWEYFQISLRFESVAEG